MNEMTNQTKEPSKGMAVASMVCGICALVFIWVPFVNLILAIVAVALGHISLCDIKNYLMITTSGMGVRSCNRLRNSRIYYS